MLDELHIANLGVIREATLTLSPGLNVVTGETGAGKTMVVTALQLLAGARGDTTLVRAGADEAVVEAHWTPPPPAMAAWLRDAGGDDPPPVEVVVSRRILAAGRSRVRIDSHLGTVTALGEVVGPAVEVHAQDSHRRLLEPATQRRLLDAWAGAAHLDAVQAHADAFDRHRDAVTRRDDLVGSMTARAREVDHLEREVAEIERAGLDDADADLDQRIDELVHAEDLRSGLATAADAVGVDGAGEPLGIAVDALRRLPTTTATSPDLAARLDEVVALAADLAADLAAAAADIDADPASLDRLQSRYAVVRGLQRRYGASVEDVLAHRDEAAARLAALQALDQDADGMEAQVAAAAQALEASADVVADGRRRAAVDLADAVTPHLHDLAMAQARFEVDVAPGPMTRHGRDLVTFLLAPNPGHPPVGLATAASGGERSRVALALEVTLADLTDAEVLVFDEVDAGVGGATAMKVGEKLAALAAGGRQVLCVTHLAQLAAWADHHMVVDKVVTDAATASSVTSVGPDDRVAELARMLGGETTNAARAHAAELLSDAVL